MQRRIRGLFLLFPKKSNKATGGVAVMLVALLLTLRPRAKVS